MRDLQSDQDGSATIEGRAVPYGETIDLGGVFETFAPGSVDPVALRRKPILWQHDTKEPIGRIDGARNEPDGLYVRAKLFPTARGADAIRLLREGVVSGLSIGFRADVDEWDGNHVTRKKVDTAEVSIATIPAYAGAGITSVRNQEEKEVTTVETTTPEVPTVDLTGLATRDDLTALESRLSALTPVAPPPPLDVREAFIAQLRDAQENGGHIRALADVVSSGNAGILPPQWSSMVRDAVDGARYVIPRCGNIAFPSVGYSITIPKVTQHTSVAARGTEKTEVESQALTTGSDTFTAAWYAGAVDIALELVMQSDPAILPLVVNSLLTQYGIVTDTAVTLAMETLATPTGEVLDFSTYARVRRAGCGLRGNDPRRVRFAGRPARAHHRIVDQPHHAG